jgi:hypothetical protein
VYAYTTSQNANANPVLEYTRPNKFQKPKYGTVTDMEAVSSVPHNPALRSPLRH